MNCQIILQAFLAIMLLSPWPMMAADANVDADGMPVVYLRGEKLGAGGESWAVNDAMRFSRSGNSYSLHLECLDGAFKIATSDWKTVDIGAPVKKPDTYQISKSQTFNGLRGGGNLIARNLKDVDISFVYVADASVIPVTITFSSSDVAGLSGTLPVIYINVYTDASHSAMNNEVISKDLSHKDYFSFSEYWLDTNGCEWLEALGAKSVGSADAPLPLEIKARGNWTRRGFSKKPFKLKLGKKQSLLGLSKSKHFALLAHADDSWGYLRNFTGFNLGKRIGLPWTPSQQPVEVVINGDYRGLYFLTESIRVEADRVPIAELEDNVSDPALVSGGYLVELDNYDEDNQIRLDEKTCTPNLPTDKLRITFDTPEVYSDLQRRFVKDQFTAMNDAVGANSDNLWSYMDLDDAVRYYIVEEIIGHTESYHGSTYMFRDRGEGQKWHFSPLWDCGNAFSGPSDDYFYKHPAFSCTWISSMRCNDKFNAKVKSTWLWFMQNGFPGLYDDIDAYTRAIASAAVADHKRWANQPVPDGGTDVVDNSDMSSARSRVSSYLSKKIKWLTSGWGDYSTGMHSEPSRDDTPAAPLPGYAVAGIDETPVATEENPALIYYDLQGMRVEAPVRGRIYIQVSPDGASKVLLR